MSGETRYVTQKTPVKLPMILFLAGYIGLILFPSEPRLVMVFSGCIIMSVLSILVNIALTLRDLKRQLSEITALLDE